MKILAVLAVAGLTLAAGACATPASDLAVESGYARGSLAVAAIQREDWDKAERLLTTERRAGADDPARLINLGQVYMATGRTGEALSMWRLALASDRHFEVETLDGRLVSTETLARQALARYDLDLRSAAR